MEMAFLKLLKCYYYILKELEKEGLLDQPLIPYEEMSYLYVVSNHNWSVVFNTGQLEIRISGDYNYNPTYAMADSQRHSPVWFKSVLAKLVLSSKNGAFRNRVLKEITAFSTAGIFAVDKRYKIHRMGLYPYNHKHVPTTSLGFE